MRTVRFGLLFGVSLMLAGVARGAPPDDRGWVARGATGMVVSPSAEASRVGAAVLADGGNAIDAAVVTSLVVGVTCPYNTGVGGGGFVLMRLAEGDRVVVLDCRETAPAAATRDMFVKASAADPSGPPPSRYGGLAVATPGLLAGQAALLDRFGTRPWGELVAPAQRLADRGFVATDRYRRIAADVRRTIDKHAALADRAAALRQCYLGGANLVAVGDRIRNAALADTLATIARDGSDAFYRGPVAESIVDAIRSAGGILTTDDLAAYKPVWRTPLRVTYRNRYELFLMPPPSSGGLVIGEVLNFLETTDLAALERRDPAAAAHWFVEAMKHAYANRARWLGDPEAVENPVGLMLDKAYAADLAARSSPDRTYPPDAYGSTTLPDDAGTAHIAVVDRWGNVVALTETINTSFGSLVMDPRSGVILNNEMDDFTAEPGTPNAFGLMQSERNAVRPKRRPLSSMSPTIVYRDGHPWLTLGAAGGPKIISSVLNILVQRIDYGRSLPEAFQAVRLHHQWQPDEIVTSGRLDPPVADGLKRRGHEFADDFDAGHAQAIELTADGMLGVSDPGKGGAPVGVR